MAIESMRHRMTGPLSSEHGSLADLRDMLDFVLRSLPGELR
ncbi:MAG: hypothetical protein Q4D19_01915 [Lautropia sp.]|nr:hypothetical protein [Lautropia sp.]